MPDKRPDHVMSGSIIGACCQHPDCDFLEAADPIHVVTTGFWCDQHCPHPECVRKRGQDAD
ncbi:MAG: hypothetical protein GY906_22705 [bacterium]|nr:hypothetical protein [bacterium]